MLPFFRNGLDTRRHATLHFTAVLSSAKKNLCEVYQSSYQLRNRRQKSEGFSKALAVLLFSFFDFLRFYCLLK